MKNNVSIKQRIHRVAFAVMGMSSLIFVSFFTSNYIVRKQGHEADDAQQGLRYVNRAESFYHTYMADMRALMLAPDQKELKKKMQEDLKSAREFITKADALTSNPILKEHIKELLELDKKEDLVADRVLTALEAGDRKTMETVFRDEDLPLLNQFLEVLEKARNIFADHREQAVKDRERAQTIGDLLMVLILLISSVSISVYSFRLAKTVSQNLESISEQLASAAQSVASATGSVSSASQNLSESTTQQAAAIEETVSSMEEMSSMLAQTSQNTVTTLNVAEEGQREGEHGRTVINKMLTAMDEIHSSNARLESIVNLIEEIKTKTKIINDIVFETRLLSFNASIEAARAGVHGKGFAVVAEEVGKLATMSGKAAEEIRTLLDSSTTEVSSVVRGTQERVNSGREISQDCQTVFETMSRSLEKIGESVRMITAATKEQELGVKQTNQAMAEMDQVTQKNSASAEDLASQAGQLKTGTDNLMGSVAELRNVIFGGGSSESGSTLGSLTIRRNYDSRDSAKDFHRSETLEAALPLNSPLDGSRQRPVIGVAATAAKSQDVSRSDSRWKAS